MTKASKTATGFRVKHGLKTAVTFPETLFASIRRRAAREHRSFSEQVVELCKVGELDLSESDAEELPNREGTVT